MSKEVLTPSSLVQVEGQSWRDVQEQERFRRREQASGVQRDVDGCSGWLTHSSFIGEGQV
jgi:hypothetical protein